MPCLGLSDLPGHLSVTHPAYAVQGRWHLGPCRSQAGRQGAFAYGGIGRPAQDVTRQLTADVRLPGLPVQQGLSQSTTIEEGDEILVSLGPGEEKLFGMPVPFWEAGGVPGVLVFALLAFLVRPL